MPAWLDRTIPIAQVVLAVILMALVLVQAKGAGLSGVFGGEGNIYRTKRGAERVIFMATIVTAALFFVVAIFNAYR